MDVIINPLQRRPEGQFEIDDVWSHKLNAPIVSIPEVSKSLQHCINFTIGPLKINTELTEDYFPEWFRRKDDANRNFNQRIIENLNKYLTDSGHKLYDLSENIQSLSGSAKLAREGLINDPYEIVELVASYLAIKMILEADRKIIFNFSLDGVSFELFPMLRKLILEPQTSGQKYLRLDIDDEIYDEIVTREFLGLKKISKKILAEKLGQTDAALSKMQSESERIWHPLVDSYARVYSNLEDS